MGHLLLTTRLGPLDILAFIEANQTYPDLIEQTEAIEFRGYTLRVLNLRSLIELKRMSTAPKDRQRLAVPRETLLQRDGQGTAP